MKVKKGDKVIVTTGKDNGKQGVVEKVLRDGDKVKVVIAGVNIATKHQRDTRSQGSRGGKVGGRIEIPAPMDISNVALVCPKCNLKTRVGYLVTDSDKKRVCKKCNKEI